MCLLIAESLVKIFRGFLDEAEKECLDSYEARKKTKLEEKIRESLTEVVRNSEELARATKEVKVNKAIIANADSGLQELMIEIQTVTNTINVECDDLRTLQEECSKARESFNKAKTQLQVKYLELEEQHKVATEMQQSIERDIANSTYEEASKRLNSARTQSGVQLTMHMSWKQLNVQESKRHMWTGQTES